MLRYVECGRETVGSTLDWRPYLTVDDEVCVFCPTVPSGSLARGVRGRSGRASSLRSDVASYGGGVLEFPTGLASARVALRAFRSSDIPWIALACDRPEMARFVPVLPSPYTEEDAAAFVAYADEAWVEGVSAPFAIDSTGGEPLGAIEVSPSSHDPALAGVGYWLRPEARGNGAATEALRLVSRWAFEALAMERLSLITDPENAASQRVAERAGFLREGVLRAWHPTRKGRRDAVMFSLLPRDLN
jgi:RimJ/RimL family protein N-acetyltransferase